MISYIANLLPTLMEVAIIGLRLLEFIKHIDNNTTWSVFLIECIQICAEFYAAAWERETLCNTATQIQQPVKLNYYIFVSRSTTTLFFLYL